MKRGWVWGFVGVGVIAGAAVVGYLRSGVAEASGRLEALKAEARREGVPIDFGTLHPKPNPARDGDSARFLSLITSSAHLGFGTTKDNSAELVGTPVGRVELRKKLALYQPVLKELDHLLAAGPIEYDRNYELGPDLVLPEFAGYKSVTHALCLRALLKGLGDRESAFRDLRTAAKVNAQLAVDPTMIGGLVRVGNEGWVVRTLNDLLAQGLADDASIAAAERVMKDLGPLPDPRRFFSAEAVMGTHMVRYIQKQVLNPPPPGPYPDDVAFTDRKGELLIRMEPVVRANEAYTLEYWRDVYRGMPAGSTDYLGIQRRLTAIGDEMERHEDVGHEFLTLSAPRFDRAFGSLELLKMRRRVAEAGIWVLRRHRQTGAWPAALPASGEAWTDEFGRRPLTCRRKGAGFIVYSVGVNGNDDGGRHYERRVGNNQEDDLAFAIPH